VAKRKKKTPSLTGEDRADPVAVPHAVLGVTASARCRGKEEGWDEDRSVGDGNAPQHDAVAMVRVIIFITLFFAPAALLVGPQTCGMLQVAAGAHHRMPRSSPGPGTTVV
jgi:hypothetical protein